MKAVYTYEERCKNPFLPLIDFEYLTFHPEYKFMVWEKYMYDYSFKSAVNQKMAVDSVFKKRFNETFSSYLEKGKGR